MEPTLSPLGPWGGRSPASPAGGDTGPPQLGSLTLRPTRMLPGPQDPSRADTAAARGEKGWGTSLPPFLLLALSFLALSSPT